MKKLIAALLVLTMVLALTGTVAMADCKFKAGDYVKFIKNANIYDNHRDSKRTSTIIRKGSTACVIDTYGSNWIKLRLDPFLLDTEFNVIAWPEGWNHPESKDGWFKVSDLKKVTLAKSIHPIDFRAENGDIYRFGYTDTYVVFSNNGNGNPGSQPLNWWIDDVNPTKKHVKATAKVWLRKTYALQKSYGRALHKDDVVCYRHVIGLDTRGIWFYGVRYKGNKLWVSSEYSKLVK